MRISCSTRWAKGWTAGNALAAIRDAGFEAVEWALPMDIAAGVLLSMSGAVASGAWTSALELAHARQAGSITLQAGDRRRQTMDALVEQVRAWAASAVAENITLELTNRAGSRLQQPSDFLELFIRAGVDSLGVVVDAGEYHLASVNPVEAIASLADHLSRLVVGDALGDRRVALGTGEVNVRHVIDRARQTGYDGWLVLDPCVDPAAADVVAMLARERSRLELMLAGG